MAHKLHPLNICVLASGSNANSLLIRSDRTALLIDAGLSARETALRLASIGVAPGAIDAICLTHEHRDHCAGVPVLQARYGMPLYANAGTIEGLMREQAAGAKLDWNVFSTGSEFQLNELAILPFAVSHDAFEPVGFTVTSGSSRIGVITDSGYVSEVMLDHLRTCDLVILEANHDEAMLDRSTRPYKLRRRIAGPRGHLSNAAAGAALRALLPGRIQTVLLAHLSAECNTPELATGTVRQALACVPGNRVIVIPTSRHQCGTPVAV